MFTGFRKKNKDDSKQKGNPTCIRATVINTKLVKLVSFACTLMFCATFTYNLLANPQGGQVAAGNVTIQQAPNSTIINQSSQKGIINWQSFNIGQQEVTHFQQPSGGITLNRISPIQGVSQIFGQLTATGQIILINPAGIYFGPSSYVNVGGIIASTADLTDQNFLNNVYHFSQNTQNSTTNTGSIINQGQIIADHGLVALVGTSVSNEGLIQANLGHIILASGEAFTLNFSGNELISFSIDAKSSHPGHGPNGQALVSAVSNTGTLNGSKILVTAQAAQGVLDNVINMQGVAQARSVNSQNGEIILSGDPDSGIVNISAKLDASGKDVGQSGGKVIVTGHNILIHSPTTIDVSGDISSGDIYVGGSAAHGAGPLPNANATIIAPNVNLIADSITKGNGGNVIIWSDQRTQFYGNIFARGGTQVGDGGFVEVSGKQNLAYFGQVNASAPHGKTGTLLLDPMNIFIVNGLAGSGNQDVPLFVAGGSLAFASPDILNNTISVGELQSLGDINITLQAKNTLTVGSSGGASAQVDLSSTLLSGILTLQAGDTATAGGGNVTFNAGSSISTGGGSVSIIAGDATIQKTGNALLDAINTSGGNISVIAQQGVTQNGIQASGGGTISIVGNNGLLSINQNINSTNNTISLTGAGITQAANTIVNAGFGALTLNGGSHAITTNSGSKLLSTDIVTLMANTMTLSTLGSAQIGGDASGTAIDFATNAVLTEGTDGTSIGIAGGAGTLSLPSNTLATIRALSVRIGDSTSGAIILDTWTPSATFAKNGVLTLDSASSIIQTGPINLSTSGSSLMLRDSNGATLTNSGNVFNNLSASISGSLTITNAATHPLTVTGLTDDIGTINGITAPGGITLISSGAGGLLRINQNISATNNAISLTGTGVNQAGSTTINAGSGALTLNAGGNAVTTNSSSRLLSTGMVTLIGNALSLSSAGTAQIGGDGSGSSTDFASNVILREGTSGTSIGIAGAAGTISLTTARLNTIHANNVRIGDSNAGTIRIAAWTPSASFAKNGVITLDSGGSLLQTGALNLATSGSSVLLRDFSGATLTTSGNVLTNLAGNISGALSIINGITHALSVTSLTDDLGTVNGIHAPLGVTLSASGVGGWLSINQNISTINNPISLSGTHLTIAANTTVNSGSGTMTGNAGANTLTLNAASQLLGIGTINLISDNFAFNTSVTPSQVGGSGTGTGLAAQVILQPNTANQTIGIAGGNGSLQLSAATLDDIRATNIRIGNSSTGNINSGTWTPGNNFAVSGVLTLDTAGTITQSGAINLATSGSHLLLRDASGVTLNSNNVFGNIAASLSSGTLAITSSGINPLIVAALSDDTGTVNGITAPGGITLDATTAGIILNSSVTANVSGNAILLTGSSFTNNAGSSALNPGMGSFQVWSTHPANDNRGDLAYHFKQYHASYGVTSVLGTGNGFLYTTAPVITPGLTGIVTRVYNATTTATFTAGNYSASGAIDGDIVTLNNPTSGIYDTKNVGVNKNVSATGIAISSASNGGASVYGYQLSADSANANVGVITTAPITVSSNPSQTKIYGNDDSTSATSAYAITSDSLFGTDSLTGSQGRIAGEGVGSYHFIRNTIAVSDDNSGNNYALTFDGSTHPFQITQRPLTASITNQNKIYGTNDPTLSGIAVTLGNIVNRRVTDMNGNTTTINDTGNAATTLASLTRTVGETVASSPYNITSVSFSALTGSSAGNYSLPSSFTVTPTLSITPATLIGSIANQTKVLGENDPTLSSIGVTLNGVINNSVTNWMGTVTSINDISNVSAHLVSLTRAVGETVGTYAITGFTLTLSGSAAGNYSNVLALSGNSSLTITNANLTNDSNATGTNLTDSNLTTTTNSNPTLSTIPDASTLNSNISSGVIFPTNYSETTTLPQATNVNHASIENGVNTGLTATASGLLIRVATTQSVGTTGQSGMQTGRQAAVDIGKQVNTPVDLPGLTNQGTKPLNLAVSPSLSPSMVTNVPTHFLKTATEGVLAALKTTAATIENFPKFALALLAITALVLVRKRKMILVRIPESNNESLPTMSFKLRTSLNDIIGFARLMYENKVGTPISAAQKEYLGDILHGSNNMLQIIKEISDRAENDANPMKATTSFPELSFKMRTALNDIIGFTELMYKDIAGGAVPREQKEYLGNILSSSHNILQLI